MIFKNCRLYIIAALFFLSNTNNSLSQLSVTVGVNFHILTESRIRDIINRQFIPNIARNKPEYIKQFSDIKIVVNANARPTALSRIDSDGQRTIEINTGVAFVVMLYEEYALIRNYYQGESNIKCSRYVTYLADVYRNITDWEKFDFNNEDLFPAKYCDVTHILTKPEFAQRFVQSIDSNRTLSSVLGLMIGHEFGHHLLGHLPPRTMTAASARRIEFEADHFASNLLGNFAPRTAAAVIFDFLEKQRRVDPFAVERRYPAEECRFLYFVAEDQRFWGGFKGHDLIAYLDNHIDIKENIPRIISFIDLNNKPGSAKSKCDNISGEETNLTSRSDNAGDNALAVCWKESIRFNEEYAKKYTKILDISKTEQDMNKRKVIACPIFRDLIDLLKNMVSNAEKCVSNPDSNDDITISKETRKMFESIVATCP